MARVIASSWQACFIPIAQRAKISHNHTAAFRTDAADVARQVVPALTTALHVILVSIVALKRDENPDDCGKEDRGRREFQKQSLLANRETAREHQQEKRHDSNGNRQNPTSPKRARRSKAINADNHNPHNGDDNHEHAYLDD